MHESINRRAFLKKMAEWALAGAGLSFSGSLLTACIKEANSNSLLGSATRDGNDPLLIYSNKGLSIYFYMILQEAINRAVQSRGWQFEATVADLDPITHSRQFEESVSKHPLAIITNPTDSEMMGKTIGRAGKIPVGIVDTPLLNGKANITVTFDNFKSGQMAAEKIVSLLEKKYGFPKGTVLNCYGNLNSYAWDLRKQGFESVMLKQKHIQLVSCPTDGDFTKVHDATYDALDEYPNLDAIHVSSEAPARGAYQALKDRGKLYPVESKKHIIFVTIDGEPIAHEWIKVGILDASISQDPIAYGEICVELLDQYSLKGQKIPFKTYSNSKYYWGEAEISDSPSGPCMVIPPFEINKGNVDDQRLWGNVAFRDWGFQYM